MMGPPELSNGSIFSSRHGRILEPTPSAFTTYFQAASTISWRDRTFFLASHRCTDGSSFTEVAAGDAAGCNSTSPGCKMRFMGTFGMSGPHSWPLKHMGHSGGGLVMLVAGREKAHVHAIPDRINRQLGGGGYTPDSENGLMDTARRIGSRHMIWPATHVAPLGKYIISVSTSEIGQDPFRVDRDRENGEILEGQRSTQV